MPVPVPLAALSCTQASCRIEIEAGTAPDRDAAVLAFVARTAERLPQAVIQPDETGSKSIVLLARAGEPLPDAIGGPY